jgi:hypothetical protein
LEFGFAHVETPQLLCSQNTGFEPWVSHTSEFMMMNSFHPNGRALLQFHVVARGESKDFQGDTIYLMLTAQGRLSLFKKAL